MLMHVYALWGGSKLIVGVLLLVYVPTFITQFVSLGMSVSPNNAPHTGMSCN